MPRTDEAGLHTLAAWLRTPRTVSDLVAHCGIHDKGVYKRLKRLERLGYVIYRFRDPRTGRLVRQTAGRGEIPVQVVANEKS